MKTTTIRICEESDARLMMRDGSFLRFVEAWSASYPQLTPKEFGLAAKARYGLTIGGTIKLARETGADDVVVMEIGERTAVRKRFNALEVFRKDNGVWWRASEDLSALNSEKVFDRSLPHICSLCSEESLWKAGAAERIASKLALQRKGQCEYLLSLGDHLLLERDESTGRFNVYSDTLEPKTLSSWEVEVDSFIKSYRERHRVSFGAF